MELRCFSCICAMCSKRDECINMPCNTREISPFECVDVVLYNECPEHDDYEAEEPEMIK